MSGFYYSARRSMLLGTFNWEVGAKRVFLIGEGYTFDPTHDTLSDIPLGLRVASQTLSAPEVSDDGWCCSVGLVFPALIGPVVKGAVFTTGDGETASLIAFISDAAGLPYTPNGTDFAFLPSSEHAGDRLGSGGWFAP